MSVDIVNLIESNPITKLTGDYQSKLIEKVKNTFTNYEQQLFLSSFYCYLKYNSRNDFIIDLDNVWKWLGFSQKNNAKMLLEKQFNIDKDYKRLLLSQQKQNISHEDGIAKKDIRGGHNKEIFMLNIETFKKICLKAGTKKADEIHDYFIKLENIMFEITTEESEELKKQVLSLENKNKEMAENLFTQKVLEKEKYLLKHFANIGNMIYIIKVKSYDNGSYIVKIGESRKGIQNRYSEHKSKYEECLLLDCFEVDKCKDFESFLHGHSLIYPSKVTTLNDHEKENELFLIGKNLTYQTLLKIINDNINNYNYRVCELLLEIENLKLKQPPQLINNDNELLKELVTTNKILVNKVNSLENSIQLILTSLNEKDTKVVTGFNQQIPNLGPRLQKINPETLQLVKVYESVTEAMNENKNIKRPSIMKSIEENTIYCGFRWLLVERNLDPNIIYDIMPTKETKVQNLGYIAKLNNDKTEIINVFLDRKAAAQLNGYISLSALDNPVKNNTLTNGYYYTLYDKCSNELIKNFEDINGEPLLYKNGIGQYDLNNNLIKEFSCKYDVIRELKMSDKTLTKALINNVPYNNYYYKELGSKAKYL
jgi:phage anti-repressor protein